MRWLFAFSCFDVVSRLAYSYRRMRTVAFMALLGCLFVSAGSVAAGADRLGAESKISAKASSGLLNGVASAGKRLIAVGQRGHILWSDDAGTQWRQAKVPVSSDLTAVQFIDDKQGWAIGHDGVVLHTENAGESWSLQLDGNGISKLLVARAEAIEASGSAVGVRDLSFLSEQGVDQSLLGLLFVDSKIGYVVGAGNLALETFDGGRSWAPLTDRIDNPRGLHLYGIGRAFNDIFIVGEQGLIVRRAEGHDRFEAVQSPYQGSWFGVVGTANRLLAYGLRGNAWVTTDAGANWRQAEVPTAVSLTSADTLPSGEILLTGLSGELFISNQAAEKFEVVPNLRSFPLASLKSLQDGQIAVAGVQGARVIDLRNKGETP